MRTLDRIARSAPLARLRQAGRPIRAEDYVENGVYVIRADLPGVDPDRDIDVSVHGGTVEIKAIRRDDFRARTRTEIPYGLYRKVITLPAGADAGTLTTHYRDGVLKVAIALPEAARPPAPLRR
ncbi:Hsp20/alpha crystallin family protein [Actinomadura sp. 21ATH]|uniref:Hsp20/alpha crystallin family protein n=1 Tax=Actinomadura sp. 21ATH TaxID=1735444 RepID=UPI0035C0BD07